MLKFCSVVITKGDNQQIVVNFKKNVQLQFVL